MRKVLLVGCAALFISIAGLAQTPSPAPLSQEALEAILGQPAVTGEQTSPQAEEPALAAAGRPLPLKSTCTASCPFGVTVTCSGSGACSRHGGPRSCNTCYASCRC